MNWDSDFTNWREDALAKAALNPSFNQSTKKWMQDAVDNKYSYQFEWLGVPIIQMPSDLIIFQQIVFNSRPDLIIETGVARGGSLLFWASIQNLLDIPGKVLGVDIEIRDHTKAAISNSKFASSIELIQGSSIDKSTVEAVRNFSSNFKRVMLVLDSNHTHEHVLDELRAYADLVTPGCALLILDTVIDDLIPYPERSWGPGASPKSAVREFMSESTLSFVNSNKLEEMSKTTVAPEGIWFRQ